MSHALQQMLRITPTCQVSRCRRNGPITMELSGPKMTTQTTNICLEHMGTMAQKARAAGLSTKFIRNGVDLDTGEPA